MRRAREEEGFAVVTAVILLTVILGLGLGLLLFSDAQQKASTREQASEAAFNVAEAALNAQVGQLSRKWPLYKTTAEAEAAMPSACTAATSTETNECPSPTDLKLDPNTGSATCSGTDAWGSSLSNQWTTYVRYDPEANPVFNSTEEKTKQSWAESEAGAVWVRAVGVVQCHPVTVVSLVTRLRVRLEAPEDAIVGNWFKVTNKGNKAIVDREGKTGSSPAPVSMRCEAPHTRASGTCEEYEVSKEQVSPAIGEEHPTSSSTTFTESQMATLKSEAQAYKTFYSLTAPYHCPTSIAELEGVQVSTYTRAPVYIEGCGALSIKANGEANCAPNSEKPETPGFLVIANGTFELSGTSTYCGLIYAANLEHLTTAVVKLQGGTHVVGGIIVDGAGGIEFGSSGNGGNPANLTFDSLAVHDLTISAGAASTRNSFRILPTGQ